MSRPGVRAVTPLVAALALSGCAGARPSPGSGDADAARAPMELAFEPQPVEVSRADLELAGKNDEQLFAIGQAAWAAGDFERAANAFGRVADLHPGSRHEAAALFDAGLSLERLEAWGEAETRFRAMARRFTGPDAVEASFRVAECAWHRQDLAAAQAQLAALAARPDLGVAAHVRALTQLGVVALEAGQPDAAEQHLRAALAAWRRGSEQERLDDYDPSQAQFYLGEVDRARFLAVKIDPSRDDERQLAAGLEAKASLLLSAQGHYLGAVRMGNADWAVAAGYRVGELYESLRDALVGAPLPPGLDAEQEAAYRAELTRQVRVLVSKAIAVYEQTIEVIRRAQPADNRFVAETRASLDRMKRTLDELPAEEVPARAPPPAPEAAPGKG
jgi:tetratricopeptide (TPR) repeat protein